MFLGKKDWYYWSLPHNIEPGLEGSIVIIMINTATQILDTAANVTQDHIQFESNRRYWDNEPL